MKKKTKKKKEEKKLTKEEKTNVKTVRELKMRYPKHLANELFQKHFYYTVAKQLYNAIGQRFLSVVWNQLETLSDQEVSRRLSNIAEDARKQLMLGRDI